MRRICQVHDRRGRKRVFFFLRVPPALSCPDIARICPNLPECARICLKLPPHLPIGGCLSDMWVVGGWGCEGDWGSPVRSRSNTNQELHLPVPPCRRTHSSSWPMLGNAATFSVWGSALLQRSDQARFSKSHTLVWPPANTASANRTCLFFRPPVNTARDMRGPMSPHVCRGLVVAVGPEHTVDTVLPDRFLSCSIHGRHSGMRRSTCSTPPPRCAPSLPWPTSQRRSAVLRRRQGRCPYPAVPSQGTTPSRCPSS